MDEMQKQLGNMVDELKEGKRQMISQQLDPSSTTNYKIQFFEEKHLHSCILFLLSLETGAASHESCKYF